MVKLKEKNKEAYTRSLLEALHGENILLFRKYFLDLHPTDQVACFISLNAEMRQRVYQYLSPAEFSEIFRGLELEEQKALITELDHSFAVEMFNQMFADDVADFFGELSESNAQSFLKKMTKAEAEDVKDLLKYPEETAGGIMTTEFIAVSDTDTVAEVMNLLRREGPEAETIYYLYVVDEHGKLVGVLSLRDLIISPADKQIKEIMSRRVVSVMTMDDQEDVAKVIQNYDFLAVPVVTNHGTLVGIVTVDDVLDVLEEEVTEDFEELSAARGSAALDLSSFDAARRRAPWLIVLLFLGLMTASLIGLFEDTLENVAVLALFIPLIAGAAGNTGTQSLAVVVRSIALGNLEKGGMIRLLRREFGTGILLGLVCGIVLSMLIALFYDANMILGFIVGFSLFCVLSIATVVGALIPLIIHKLNIDPAVASGPFITTINDIIGLMIYFSIASLLLQYL
mgnify:CR=1 FL=1